MRRLLLLMSLSGLATADDRATCQGDACSEACESIPPLVLLPPTEGGEPSPAKLTEQEYALLGDDLEAFRAGPTPSPSGVTGLCEGDGGCRTALGDAPGRIGSGKHSIVATLDLPRLGPFTWSIDFQQQCIIETRRGESFSAERSETVKAHYDVSSADTRQWSQVLHTFDSPSDAGREACAWRLQFETSRGTKSIEGEYEIPWVGDVGEVRD